MVVPVSGDGQAGAVGRGQVVHVAVLVQGWGGGSVCAQGRGVVLLQGRAGGGGGVRRG